MYTVFTFNPKTAENGTFHTNDIAGCANDVQPVPPPGFTMKPHIWANLPSFQKFLEEYDISDQLMRIYRDMDYLECGPKVIHIECSDTNLTIITESLLTPVTRKWIIDHHDEIGQFLERMHNHGYYHGNLWRDYMLLNKDGNLRLINFETMFTRDEICSDIVEEWAADSGNSVEELIEWELHDSFLKQDHITDGEIVAATIKRFGQASAK